MSASPASSSSETESGVPILVVDDEEIVLVALRDTLGQQRYQVFPAQNAVQALELLKQRPFAVVLTDQQMPMLTGLEFLVEVKKMQPDATRLLITAVLSLNTVIDAINKAEVFRFILKPWQREDLLQTIGAAVDRYHALQRERNKLSEALAANETLIRENQMLRQRLDNSNRRK